MNNDLKKASQLQKLCWIYLEELSTHFSFLHKTGSAAAPGCFSPGSAGWVPPLGAPHPWLMRQAATPATAHQSQPLPLATLKAQVSKGQLDLCYCCKQPSQPKTRRKKRKKRGAGGEMTTWNWSDFRLLQRLQVTCLYSVFGSSWQQGHRHGMLLCHFYRDKFPERSCTWNKLNQRKSESAGELSSPLPAQCSTFIIALAG